MAQTKTAEFVVSIVCRDAAYLTAPLVNSENLWHWIAAAAQALSFYLRLSQELPAKTPP